MKNFIPFALPDISRSDIEEVVDTLKSNWITTGPKTKIFEDNFAKYLGTAYAVAVNSGTAGLHLALECIGLKANDKVITTPYTFTATAEVIRYFNADPIFIDIRAADYNIDVAKIERFCDEECALKRGVLYHRKTKAPVKAILPVHIGGYPCKMDAIIKIAKRYHLKVVEDAAHALPSSYNGKRIGTISDLTVFSFYATKPITTGEGGMIVTNNPEYYRRMKMMRLHGIDSDVWNRYTCKKPLWYYEVIEAGFKYNMTDIAASLGIQQLKRVGSLFRKRRSIAAIYNKVLSRIDDIRLPAYDKAQGHSWHLYIVELTSRRFSRDDFIKRLYEAGIGTSVHFIPLHIQPYYKNKYKFAAWDFPIAYRCYKNVISLPIYTRLSEQDVSRIVNTIKRLLS